MTLQRNSSPASAFAVALLNEFVRLGVRDVVLSPGSRSQALGLAAAGLERAGMVRLRVRIDERVAGFLAVGLSAESGRPVLVITTSGTAVANLHPAVLEAHHSGVPLVVVTADRPENLRGIGSNQTTDQAGIFGSAVKRSWDVGAPTGETGEREAAAQLARDALAAALGPVHLNLAFAEPLSGTFEASRAQAVAPVAVEPAVVEPGEQRASAPMELIGGSGVIVVAGHGAGETAEATARALGAPLLAEVSSGAHFGPNLIVAYRELLAKAEFLNGIKRVIVFGHPTLSREIPALIQRPGVATIVVRSDSREDYNPGRRVAHFVDAVSVSSDAEESPDARAWLGRWIATSRAVLDNDDSAAIDGAAIEGARANADFARSALALLRTPVTRRLLVEIVWRVTWPHDRLVLAASRLIREADALVPGKKIRVHANRGLAGIDGTIATGVGIALASQAEPGAETAGVTRVLLGDLAFFHDVGGLAFGKGEPRPRIQVIVGNDGGGTLFDSLEVAGTADAGDFERVLLTPQTASIEHLATAYGWEYRHAANRGDLDEALAPPARPTVIEVPLPRYPDAHE
jgi:2-succinyl-5-enolpyruvyl-6-hydroxy-3-cyclohexene-1-carboxylate synthase